MPLKFSASAIKRVKFVEANFNPAARYFKRQIKEKYAKIYNYKRRMLSHGYFSDHDAGLYIRRGVQVLLDILG